MDQTINSLQTLDIPQVKGLVPLLEEYGIDNDLLGGEVDTMRANKNEQILNICQFPFRFDGYILFFLKKGRFTLDINIRSYEMRENSLIFMMPGDIIKITNNDKQHLDKAEVVFFMMSRAFISDIQIDISKVFKENLHLMHDPCITLNEVQLAIVDDYFSLVKRLLPAPLKNKREIISSLMTSLTYLSTNLWTNQADKAQKERKEPKTSARLNQILERFLALVAEYHTTERGMAFYADKMCLTPKYLSKLVKEASGKSAPEWIDQFVILEAKNMLKYSNMAIKEIVYKLHFPNQSVFYKFFKAHTGMTPSDYRKQ